MLRIAALVGGASFLGGVMGSTANMGGDCSGSSGQDCKNGLFCLTAGSGDTFPACRTGTCVVTKGDSGTKCGCEAGKIPTGSAANTATCTAKATTAAGTSCWGAAHGVGYSLTADTQFSCYGTGAAGKIGCQKGLAYKTSTSTCVKPTVGDAKSLYGTGSVDGMANVTGADTATMWSHKTTDLTGSVEVNGTQIDCKAGYYATAASVCAVKGAAGAGALIGGNCLVLADMKKAPNYKASMDSKNLACVGTAGSVGKIKCAAGSIPSSSDCVAPILGASCVSTAAGTTAQFNDDSNTTVKFVMPAEYTCPTSAVTGLTTPNAAANKLNCAAKHKRCFKGDAHAGNTNTICVAEATACAGEHSKLGDYCSADSNCKRQRNNGGAITTAMVCTANMDTTKTCKCPSAAAADGNDCPAANTATANSEVGVGNLVGAACEGALFQTVTGYGSYSLNTMDEGYECPTGGDVVACKAGTVTSYAGGKLTSTKYIEDNSRKCAAWKGDVAGKQACKTGSDPTGFAPGTACTSNQIVCATSSTTKICKINKGMCGKDAAKDNGCKCPLGMHKAANTDDPDKDETACIKSVVGAACSAAPAATHPSATNYYDCTSKKLACKSSALECKNAGPMKGLCIPKSAMTTATAAALLKDYTLCPTTKAPTTAAPSAASGIVVPLVSLLLAGALLA